MVVATICIILIVNFVITILSFKLQPAKIVTNDFEISSNVLSFRDVEFDHCWSLVTLLDLYRVRINLTFFLELKAPENFTTMIDENLTELIVLAFLFMLLSKSKLFVFGSMTLLIKENSVNGKVSLDD